MGSRGGFGSLPRYFPPYPSRGQLPTTEPRNNQGTNQRVVVDVTKLLCSNSCFSYLDAVRQLAFQADIWPWQTVWQTRQIQFKEVQCWQLSIPSASTVFLRRDEFCIWYNPHDPANTQSALLCRCCYSFPIWKMSSLMLLIVFWKILSKSFVKGNRSSNKCTTASGTSERTNRDLGILGMSLGACKCARHEYFFGFIFFFFPSFLLNIETLSA